LTQQEADGNRTVKTKVEIWRGVVTGMNPGAAVSVAPTPGCPYDYIIVLCEYTSLDNDLDKSTTTDTNRTTGTTEAVSQNDELFFGCIHGQGTNATTPSNGFSNLSKGGSYSRLSVGDLIVNAGGQAAFVVSAGTGTAGSMVTFRGSMVAIAGVTRDQSGNPLGSCDVRAFKTDNNQLVDTTVSDENGNYTVNVLDTTNHFIVAFKAGSPNVKGVTDVTLQGA
jgi:hypothetical protein